METQADSRIHIAIHLRPVCVVGGAGGGRSPFPEAQFSNDSMQEALPELRKKSKVPHLVGLWLTTLFTLGSYHTYRHHC